MHNISERNGCKTVFSGMHINYIYLCYKSGIKLLDISQNNRFLQLFLCV